MRRSRTGLWLAIGVGLPVLLAALVLVVALRGERPRTADRQAPAPWLVAYPLEGRAPLRVRFDATGSSDDVGVTLQRWTFEDGTTADGEVVDHVFATAGTYDTTLTIQDAAGHKRTRQVRIAVTAPAPDHRDPVARLQASSTAGTAPLDVKLDASDSSDDRGVARVVWTIGGKTHEGRTFEHRFAEPGTHEVSLTVWDAAGHRDEASTTILVEPGPPSEPPKAVLRVTPAHAVAPADVELDARASTDDRAVILHRWTFGDGTSVDGALVTHRFAKAAKHQVTLTVGDDSGQRDHTTVEVVIEEPRITTERVLFDDGPADGVWDGSWAQVRPTSDPVHAGRFAARVKAGAHGAMSLRFAPERLDAYDRLAFWIRGDEAEALLVRALVQNGGREELLTPVEVKPYLRAAPGSAWMRGAVPLEALEADGRLVTGFAWQVGGAPTHAPFVVDDVALLPPDRALPVLADCAPPPAIRDFVRRDGSQLFVEGAPYRAVGANLYYLQQQLAGHVQTGEVRPLALVREALGAAACSGSNVVRILAFNEHPPEAQDAAVIQSAPGIVREEGLLGLDLAIAEAKAHHLRVVLVLSNNWSHFGGLPRYASWAGVEPDEALGDERVRSWLAEYAATLARRTNVYTGIPYRDEPAILAVEIANELRCRGCPPGRDATAFTRALARAVAPLWPNHLLSDGGEGFDDKPAAYPGLEGTTAVSGEEGASFRRIAQIPEIDLASYHLYPQYWGLDSEQAGFWIDAHEAIARRAGKVAFLGEFGEKAGDASRALTYERWLDRVFGANGGSLALVWQIAYDQRADNDGFVLSPGRSPRTLATIARQAGFLGEPGLEGRPLAVHRTEEAPELP